MRIIKIGELLILSQRDGAPISDGFAELTIEPTVVGGRIVDIPILTPPYLRARNQADDDADLAAAEQRARDGALATFDGPTKNHMSQEVRALLSDYNKRINWLTNRVEEVQEVLSAIRDQLRGTQARQNVPATFPMATSTRPRAAARQAVRDGLAAGDGDDT